MENEAIAGYPLSRDQEVSETSDGPMADRGQHQTSPPTGTGEEAGAPQRGAVMSEGPSASDDVWKGVTVSELREGGWDPGLRQRQHALVRAALAGEDRAVHRLQQAFWATIHAGVGDISWATERFISRDALAWQFFQYFILGIRPNLREPPPGAPSAADEEPRVLPESLDDVRPGLQIWLDKSRQTLRGFVYSRVVGLCGDALRRANHQAHIDRDSLHLAISGTDMDERDGSSPYAPERAVLLAEGIRRVMATLHVLTERERDVVLALRRDESQVEIAERLEISPPAVFAIKRRAFAKLAAALTQTPSNLESR